MEEPEPSPMMTIPRNSILMETAENAVLVEFRSEIFKHRLVLDFHLFQKILAKTLCRDA